MHEEEYWHFYTDCGSYRLLTFMYRLLFSISILIFVLYPTTGGVGDCLSGYCLAGGGPWPGSGCVLLSAGDSAQNNTVRRFGHRTY